MYVELKTGHNDDGPAWITNVRFFKWGRSIHFNGKELLNIGRRGMQGNYMDVETREEYLVLGPKKNGGDRHKCGSGPIEVDPAIADQYHVEI